MSRPRRDRWTIAMTAIWFGLDVVATCVAARNWGDARAYAGVVRGMITTAEKRISGRREHAKGQGGFSSPQS